MDGIYPPANARAWQNNRRCLSAEQCSEHFGSLIPALRRQLVHVRVVVGVDVVDEVVETVADR
jgi:hypothetical protein